MDNLPDSKTSGPAAAEVLVQSKTPVDEKPLKLNTKRTMWIGVAFLGILLLWGVYDAYCSNFLTFLLSSGKCSFHCLSSSE